MRKFLVELYLSRRSDGLAEAAARAREAAEQLTGEGMEVRFLSSIFVPEDETCFCLYAAASAEAVALASTRAALPYLRVVEAALAPANDVGSR